MNAVIVLSLLKTIMAQSCTGQDVLVDDFSTTQRKFFDNADRQINKLGGDYGTDGRTTFTIDTNAQTITVTPQQNTDVFFFAKFDERACFDLTKYYAFQFELLAPVGASGTFTLTQMKADCSGRVEGGDSTYVPLSKYYTTPGQKQVITLPFKDFTDLASGAGSFDFVHLKDWTFVDMKPLGQPFVMSNMKLIACDPNPAPPVPPTTTTTTTPTAQNVKSSADSAFQLGGWLMLLGFFL